MHNTPNPMLELPCRAILVGVVAITLCAACTGQVGEGVLHETVGTDLAGNVQPLRSGVFDVLGQQVVLHYIEQDGMAVVGDMVLPLPVADLEPTDGLSSSALTALENRASRWPGAVVSYVFAPGYADPEVALAAMREIEAVTPVRFRPRSETRHYDYVELINMHPNQNYCWSQLGRQTGRQRAATGNCGKGTVIHELLHTLGVIHEQNRNDRDDHVRINWENIEAGRSHNFRQRRSYWRTEGDWEEYVPGTLDVGAYDYDSIMHYRGWAFSNGRGPTIERLDGGLLHRTYQLSAGDIAGLNELYANPSPPSTWEYNQNGPGGGP